MNCDKFQTLLFFLQAGIEHNTCECISASDTGLWTLNTGSFRSSLEFRPHLGASSERMSRTYLQRKSCLSEEVAVSDREVCNCPGQKRVFSGSKAYAIYYIFPITVADKCPRVFRDFLKIDIVYEFCSLVKNSKGTFFFNSLPSWE